MVYVADDDYRDLADMREQSKASSNRMSLRDQIASDLSRYAGKVLQEQAQEQDRKSLLDKIKELDQANAVYEITIADLKQRLADAAVAKDAADAERDAVISALRNDVAVAIQMVSDYAVALEFLSAHTAGLYETIDEQGKQLTDASIYIVGLKVVAGLV